MPKESFFVRNHSWSLAKAPPRFIASITRALLSRQRVRALASPLVLPWPDLIWWWHMQERLLDLDDRRLLDFS